jgi:ribosomal protein L37E
MRLFKRHREDEPTEAPCPRCGVPVPVEALECAVCGWDTRETHVGAEATFDRSRPVDEDDERRV